jgi:hypothetical protein
MYLWIWNKWETEETQRDVVEISRYLCATGEEEKRGFSYHADS